MALFIDDSDSTTDYYYYKEDPVPFSDLGLSSIFPLTMSGWCKPIAINDHDAIMSIGDDTSTFGVASLNLRSTGYATAEVLKRGGSAMASSASQYSADVWQHFCAVFASSTSRTVYMDGVAGTEVTTSADVKGDSAKRLSIGEYATTWNREMNGHLADVALWNVALSASEVAILADAYTAIQVRPDSLVSYYPFVSNSVDVMGNNYLSFGTDGTAGSSTFAEHTRIIEDAPVMSRSAWGGI